MVEKGQDGLPKEIEPQKEVKIAKITQTKFLGDGALRDKGRELEPPFGAR